MGSFNHSLGCAAFSTLGLLYSSSGSLPVSVSPIFHPLFFPVSFSHLWRIKIQITDDHIAAHKCHMIKQNVENIQKADFCLFSSSKSLNLSHDPCALTLLLPLMNYQRFTAPQQQLQSVRYYLCHSLYLNIKTINIYKIIKSKIDLFTIFNPYQLLMQWFYILGNNLIAFLLRVR